MSQPLFFVGWHQPSDAHRFERCMISVNRLHGKHGRKSDFPVNEWMMDSGAFTQVDRHGRHSLDPKAYAELIRRWSRCGQLVCAVAQDYMCEPPMLEKVWGDALSRVDQDPDTSSHEVTCNGGITIDRYRHLLEEFGGRPPVHILPVLQGWTVADYLWHLREYGSLLTHGMWVGVGSVCKRNVAPGVIEDILVAIHRERPDLRLHGFGLKLTAISSAVVREHLYSHDSLASSFGARKNGRSSNDWREADAYADRVLGIPAAQLSLVEDLRGRAA